MVRRTGAALLATMAVLAGPTFAQEDVGAWNAQRAAAFSQVCMGTAPTFAGLGQAAGQAGFRNLDGNVVLEPEVVVSLLSDGRTCTCFMTMGALDPDSLVMTLFQRLLADFPNGWAPESQGGTVNDTTFVRDGVPVRLLLRPAQIDGAYWLDARVIAPGACGG